MCNIAGYVGTRDAAPILIEMMLREEGWAGGYQTGIATIHEGKIYYAKITGDTKRLLDYTDAAKLDITPAPDTVIRVFMTWQASDAFVKLPPQTLTASAQPPAPVYTSPKC